MSVANYFSSFLFLFLTGGIALAQNVDNSVVSNDSNRIKKKLWATQYYILSAKSITAGTGVTISGSAKDPFQFTIDTCAFCEAAIEGTLSVQDSNNNVVTLNYGGLSTNPYVDCSKCIKNNALNIDKLNRTIWIRAKGKYGDGVKGYKLVPFKSIAVDPSVIPIGSVIYIPSLAGKIIPVSDSDTMIHDGYLYSVDIGGAIKGHHIDIFTGHISYHVLPGIITSNSTLTFEAFLIKDDNIKAILEKLHR